MSTNAFITTPPRVIIYNPATNQCRRMFVYLGDAPKHIINAVTNYSRAHDAELREFYGPTFKDKLGLNIRDPSSAGIYWGAQSNILGGDESPPTPRQADKRAAARDLRRFLGASSTDADLDIEDIERLLSSTSQVSQLSAKDVVAHAVLKFDSGVEYVKNVHLFPEDKFSEVKEKIFISTGIPAYRQHIFYRVHERVQQLYKLWAEGLYNVDIRIINSSKDRILGVPIDKMLYDLRNESRIEANDTFSTMETSMEYGYDLYVVDIQQYIADIHVQLVETMKDSYQFDIFYYGFVVKYWPQFTKECFYDYMINEQELQHKYPELAKNRAVLDNIYAVEKDIINYNYKNYLRAEKWAESAGMSIAITQMTAFVNSPNVQVNIRNLFDKLRVSRCIPEIHAYYEHEGRRYLLRKRHIKNAADIQFPIGNIMKTGLVMAISLRKADQESFHMRTTSTIMQNEQMRYIYLNILNNGRYYIRTLWNEEDELEFTDIIKVVKKFIDPIITNINKLSRYVFVNGGELTMLTKQNINYQGLNVCVFWKRVILESTFKIVKSLWEPYMRARITGPRNIQQYDKYEIWFRKGMYDFDTGAIERIITASNNIVLNNYYAFLSNNTIKQKWDQNYDGRIMRMSHRTTSVKFEIIDVREREFTLFYRYIVMFVYRAVHDERVQKAMASSRVYTDVRKLRKLREQDPELFNLKKHGSKKLYSTACQNPRQPLIYTPDEIKSMPAAEVKKLTQYWNFTLNKPAYYACPSKKYPHLSFTAADIHPKHYCLPCCAKDISNVESKKMRINSICLAKHRHPTSADFGDIMSSRHIMNYGKDIDVARLSRLPNTTIKNLLQNTLSEGRRSFYLYGVQQHVPGVSNIGVIYAAAAALDMPVERLIGELIEGLQASGGLFQMLIGGKLVEYFYNLDDFVKSLRAYFVEMKLVSVEYQKFKQWTELFIEMLHVIMRVSIITFIDEAGSGHMELYLPDVIKSEISYVNQLNKALTAILENQTYVLAVRRQNKFYPMFVINSEEYFRASEIDQRTFKYEDNVIKIIYDMIAFADRMGNREINQPINLRVLQEFIAARKGYKMTLKYINRQNLCYAALISGPAGSVYVPVDYSTHTPDGVSITYDVFRIDGGLDLPVAALTTFIADINAFIDTKYKSGHIYIYAQLQPRRVLTLKGTPVALECGQSAYYFTSGDPPTTLERRDIKYDMTEVNKLIIAREPPAADNRQRLLGEALYNNYIYQLFLIEFINYLENERNEQMRAKILEIIARPTFRKNVAETVAAFKRLLLKDWPRDYAAIEQQLILFYYMGEKKETIIANINDNDFEFDYITKNKLMRMGPAEMRRELRKIADIFAIQKDFDTSAIEFPNIYMPCSITLTGDKYCEGKKLIVNRNIDELIDILAEDITDPLKIQYLMTAVYSDNIRNVLDFEQPPHEIITIYKLNE